MVGLGRQSTVEGLGCRILGGVGMKGLGLQDSDFGIRDASALLHRMPFWGSRVVFLN